MGQLQLNFLLQRGLRPSDCLLDIGCGSLRGGRHFIPYLAAGNYLGLEKHQELVASGLAYELPRDTLSEKKPEFVISETFEFDRFSKKPDFSIAHSVFTHLSAEDVRLCLRRLRAFVNAHHALYATFFDGSPAANVRESHDILRFHYSRTQMEEFGEQTGWRPEYIGSWNHPRGQLMMRYQAVD